MKWVHCIILSMVAITLGTYAQGNMYWHNGMVFGKAAMKDITSYQNTDLFLGNYYRVLQFNHILSETDKQIMQKEGIMILEYIPDYLYLASIHPSVSRAKNSITGLIASFELTKSHKLSKQLLYGDPCMKEADKSLLVVKYMKGIDVLEIKELLQSQNISTDRMFSYNQIFYAKLNERQLNWLAAAAWVQFIDCESAAGEPEDREGRSMHRVNLVSSNAKENIFLNGNGVKVMVRDDGFVGPHIDFQGRIHQDVRDDIGTHGDGVSGVLTGAGNYDPLVEGMAPGAELYVINYQPDFLDKTLDFHQKEGVVITNSSYSNGCNIGYTIEAQVVDKQIFENPELIHVFSAGNSNGADCGYGAGNQWGNVTGGHKIGKNALTTANLRLDGTLESSSSRGPTKDGRLKPEISARGTNELSTAPGNSTQVFGGTSAASPGVAGVCALLYEAYKNFHSGQNPESALIKAAILNTATDLGTPGPDYQFGFGAIDVYRAYHLIAENRFQKHSIQHKETQEYKITISPGSPLAKFMIYWAEPEASLLAKKALINDLDMEVIDPSGTIHKPWLLNPTPNPVTLAEGASIGVDTLNNFEQVSIPFPSGGIYTVRIKGSFLPSNKVDFYLLHELEDKLLRLSFPVGGEKFNITENTQVYYTAYGVDSIKVFFSSDAGVHWQSLGAEVAGSRLHSIIIPNNLSSDSCLIEISQGNVKERSSFFTITNGVQGFKIIKYCPDQIELSWKRTSKDSFKIYQLGDKYMDPIKVTSDTSISLKQGDPRIKKWFSIAAYNKTILSIRELAISTPDTLIACGITRDLALANSELNPLELYSCGELHVTPVFKVINHTKNLQTGFKIKALSKNQIVEQTYTESINPFDTIEVTFSNEIIIENFGAQQMTAWLDFSQDENPFNDTVFIKTNIIELPEKNGVYPMLESFTGISFPQQWLQKNEAFDSKWDVATVKDKTGADGNALIFASANSIYNSFPITLVSKTVDLTAAVQPYLYFDFSLHHFATNIYYDSIRIKVKQVCGKQRKEKIVLSGISTELNTVDPTGNQNWLPTDSAWFSLAYDLSEFKGSKIVVEFEIVRGIGDRTFLDNVQVREKILGTEKADINISPNPACYTKFVTFHDSSAIDGKRYLWDLGSTANPRYYSDKGPFISKFNTGGFKRIILKIKSDINNDAILIKDLTLASPGIANYSFKIESGRTVSFTNTSLNAVSYLWDFGDGTFSSEINPTHTFDSAKMYRVKLTMTNICGTYTRSINLDLTLTFNEGVSENSLINIFPNPTFQDVFVISKERINSYRLFNAEGKLVLQKQKVNANQIDVSLKYLAAGIYSLNIVTDNHLLTRKIEKKE